MAKRYDPFHDPFPPAQVAFMAVCPVLFELDDDMWHLGWESFWCGEETDLSDCYVSPKMFDPRLERIRAHLQDQRIVDLEKVRQPACFPLLHTAVRLMDEALVAQTAEKVWEAVQAIRYATQPTWDYLQSLMIGALGPFGAFFFYLAIYEETPVREIAKRLENEWGWRPSCWTSESAGLLLEDTKAVAPFILRPLQRNILKALTGRALKKMALAAEVCGGEDNGNILYRPGGIKELMERGIVKLERGVGFYRPDAPPLVVTHKSWPPSEHRGRTSANR